MKPDVVEVATPVVLPLAATVGKQFRPHGVARTRSFGLPAAPEPRPAPRFLSAAELLAPVAADAVTAYVMEPPEKARNAILERRVPEPMPAASRVPAPARGLSRRVFARAIAYMEEHLGDKPSLGELAKAAGVSRFHFARLFRVTTGESPMNYCLRMRVERAKHLLLEGNRRTCDIALDLGFFDQSHFSRTFRRLTGVSPGEYVRMCDVAEVAF